MGTKKLVVLTLFLASVMLIDASQGGPLLHSKSTLSQGQTLSAYIKTNLLARRRSERWAGNHSGPTPSQAVVESLSPTQAQEPTDVEKISPTKPPFQNNYFQSNTFDPEQNSELPLTITPTTTVNQVGDEHQGSQNMLGNFFGGMSFFGGAPKPSELTPTKVGIPPPTRTPTKTPTNAPLQNNSIQLTVTPVLTSTPTFIPVNNSEMPSTVTPTVAEKQVAPEKPKSKNIFDNFFESMPYFDRVAKSEEAKSTEMDKDKQDELKEIREVERSKRLLETFDRVTKSMGPLGSLLKRTFEQYLK